MKMGGVLEAKFGANQIRHCEKSRKKQHYQSAFSYFA